MCVPAYGRCQSGTPPCYAAPPEIPALAAHFLASQARSYRPPGNQRNQNAVKCDAGSPGATGRSPWISLVFSVSLSCLSSRSLSRARARPRSLTRIVICANTRAHTASDLRRTYASAWWASTTISRVLHPVVDVFPFMCKQIRTSFLPCAFSAPPCPPPPPTAAAAVATAAARAFASERHRRVT